MANKHDWTLHSRLIDQIAKNRLSEEALANGITGLPLDVMRDAMITELAAGSFGGGGGTGLNMVADRNALDTFVATAEDDTAVVDKFAGIAYRVVANAPVALFDRTREEVNAKSFGAQADFGTLLVTAQDITDNASRWLGFYEVNDTWDYVGLQEALFAAFLKVREARTVDVGASTTVVPVTGAAMPVDLYKGGTLWLTSGPNRNERRFILSNTATSLTLADALTAPPGAGDTVHIVSWLGLEGEAIDARPVYIPRGSYGINKTLFVQHVLGGIIRGAGRFQTDISTKTPRIPTLQTNGLAYSWVEGIQFGTKSGNWASDWQPLHAYGVGEWVVGSTTGWLFQCTTAGTSGATRPGWTTYSGASTVNDGTVVWTRVLNTPIVDLNWDGRFVGWSGGNQSNTFANCKFTGQGRKVPNGVAIALSGDGSMGSENTFLNCFWQWFVMSGFHSNGLNALQNTIIGGNIAQCDLYGVYCERGSAYVYSCGFQNGVASQWDNGGADFRMSNSVADHSIASGCRSESLVFCDLGADHILETHGCYSTVTNGIWNPGKAYGVGTLITGVLRDRRDGRLWRCKVAGTSGGTPVLAATNATGGTTTSVVKTGAGWTPNQYALKWVRIVTGSAAGQSRWIESNTADTLLISGAEGQSPFSVAVDATSTFEIYDEPRWFEKNGDFVDGTVTWEKLDTIAYGGGVQVRGGMHAWGRSSLNEASSVHSSFFTRPDWIDASSTFGTGQPAGQFLLPVLSVVQAQVFRNTYGTPLSAGQTRWNPLGTWPLDPIDLQAEDSPSSYRRRKLSTLAITELGAGSALYFSNRHGTAGIRRGDFEAGELRRILHVEGRLGKETPNNHDSTFSQAMTYPTNARGDDLEITGGLSTGTGAPGRVILEAASAGPTGAGVNLPQARAAVTPSGLIVAPGLGADPVRRDVARTLTFDPPSIVDGAFSSTSVTVFGAVPGDVAMASFVDALVGPIPDGMWLSASVIGDDTVRVTFHNETGSTQDLGSGTLRVEVRSRQPVPAGTGDIALLITALGGDAVVPAFYDTRVGITLDGTSEHVTDWADARGGGFGPTLIAPSVPARPPWDAARLRILAERFTGLASAASPLFDLSLSDFTVVLVAGMTEVGGQNGRTGISNDVNGNACAVEADTSNAVDKRHYIGRFRNARLPSDTLFDGDPLRLILVSTSGTTGTIEVFDRVAASGTISSPAAGDNPFAINGGGQDGTVHIRAALVVNKLLTAAEKALVRQWAMSRHEPYMA